MTRYFTSNGIRIALGLLITALALWAAIVNDDRGLAAIQRLDFLAYDLRLNQTLPAHREVAENVVIVDIDENSLRVEGRWPWSRQKMAQLVANLKQAGVRVIGFDVAFAEPERNVARELLDATTRDGTAPYQEYLEQLVPALDWDELFASVLKDQNVVLGFLLHSVEEESVGALPSPWSLYPQGDGPPLTIPMMTSHTGNIKVLQKAANYGGFLNTTTSVDGVLRSTPLVLGHDDMIYPSLSLAMARRYNKALRFKVETAVAGDTERVVGLWLDREMIATDKYGRVLVPYSGKRGGVTYISATDVLQAQYPAELAHLADTAVLVGTSALGLADLVSTPTSPNFPGVEVHATVLHQILSGRPFPRQPDWANAANALAIVATGLLLSLLCPAFGALSITVFTVLFTALVVGGNAWLWSARGIALSPVMPLFTVLAIVSLNIIWGYFAEAKQKRQVRKAFSSYMAPALVEQLVSNPDMLSLTGEEREMSFLFSDIAGFTTFTESASPELLVSVLNEYLDAMCRAVMENGGTIDKIVGDAVVGIFNAPLDQPDHAERAVNCALAMNAISIDFIAKMAQRGYPFGVTRVGVNTGRAIVGNFGGSERFDYTAHGDSINAAARLESVNKHLGTQICISGTTVAQCPNHHFRHIGALVLKGKSEALEAFEPITAQQAATPFIARYNEAFELLQQEDPRAAPLFAQLYQEFPEDPLVKLHHERILAGDLSATIVLSEK